MNKRREWLGIVLAAAITVFALPAWIDWAGAQDVPTAEAAYGRRFPANWKAVHVNHGHFSEETRGMPDEHPLQFALLTLLAFGPGAVVFAFGVRQGYRRSISASGNGAVPY